MFSGRFLYHCDTGRALGIMFRRVVQWDAPAVTLMWLLAITVVIEFFHEYILPLAMFALLCFIAWQHPRCQRYLKQRRARTSQRAALRPRVTPPRGSEQQAGATPAAQEECLLQVKERIESQRRLMWGQFNERRLRFYDPPGWSTAEGSTAEAPKPEEDGVRYVWKIEVNQFTDSEGWRYARHFGKTAVWQNTFSLNMFVRFRKHFGVPLAPANSVNSSGGSQVSSVLAMAASRSTTFCGGTKATGTAPAAGPKAWPPLAGPTTTPPGGEGWTASAGLGSEQRGPAKNGPEFGIAKTPFHDWFQQHLLRFSLLQHHMEFWMDWYERRKNLFCGATVDTSTFALLGVLGLLVVACVLPTRWLLIAWIYAFAWDGLMNGKLMRKNRDTFIRALKDTADSLWLKDDDSRAKARSWNARTSLDDVVDSGVELLTLRAWIRADFFGGQPVGTVTLRAVQRCQTLGDLAVLVIWTSDLFAKRRQRPRVWYRSTVRNLLDHVPSDVTMFQPLTCVV